MRVLRGRGLAVAAVLVVTLAACGRSDPEGADTGAAAASPPPAENPMQQAAEANADGAGANAAANTPGLDTPNPDAQATDRTTLGPDGRPQRAQEPAARGVLRAPGASLRPGWRASFRRLEQQLGGRSGIAIATSADRPATAIGSLRSGPAWSTIKVAIAMAVEQDAGGRPDPVTEDLIARALTASDNAAAERLWDRLGDRAAHRTQALLAAAGDTATTVQSERVRAEFSPYGQTDWSTRAQARFVAALPCLPHGRRVLDLMGRVQADQRWGLGSAGVPARFKGGWGPDPSGRYLVRQMGLLTIDGKAVAVAIATEPADGQFATATVAATRLAEWVARHVDPAGLSKSTC